MTRKTKFLCLAVLAMSVAGFGGWWFWQNRVGEQPQLTLHRVQLEDVEESVSALGTLQPLQYVDVGTQVSGQLQKLFVDIGDVVKEGQQLAQIDQTVYQTRVNAGEAQLQALRSQIAEKTAQKRLAELQLARQTQLLAINATSKDAFDTADAMFKQVSAQIGALEAQVKQTQSTLNGDLANLNYTRIFAPMSGTVVSLTAKQGQTLNANQTAPIILRIADLDTMTVWVQVSEADVPKLSIGMPAYFSTLGRSDKRWQGTLRQVMPTPEVVNNVVLYNALFDVPNRERDLMTQMSAQVFFVLGSSKNTMTVPTAALRRQPGANGQVRYSVQVMRDGKPQPQPVTIGVGNRISTEIKSGLNVGDDVVIGSDSSRQRPGVGPGSGAPSGPPAAMRQPRL